MTVSDDDESIGLFEPLIVSEGAKSRTTLNRLALSLAEKSFAYAASLPFPIEESLADIIRVTDCCYSNLIEGHLAHPLDIDRAMRGTYSGDPLKRDLQLEALAHIETQRWIDHGSMSAAPLTVQAIVEIHRRFCERLPRRFLTIKVDGGSRQLSLVPGAFRTERAQVGRHVTISPGAIPRFLSRMERAYKSISKTDKILNAACGHHRLLWVHPFSDGNGRVARLSSYAAIQYALGKCPWSISRGLALREKAYKMHLQSCDEPRRGSLDGRGTLSESALAGFAEFFLDTCIGQIDFMLDLMQPQELRARVLTWAVEEIRLGAIPHRSDVILSDIIQHGELARAEVKNLIGSSENSARQLTAALIKIGVVASATSNSPLRLAFPIKLATRFLPGLLPEG